MTRRKLTTNKHELARTKPAEKRQIAQIKRILRFAEFEFVGKMGEIPIRSAAGGRPPEGGEDRKLKVY